MAARPNDADIINLPEDLWQSKTKVQAPSVTVCTQDGIRVERKHFCVQLGDKLPFNSINNVRIRGIDSNGTVTDALESQVTLTAVFHSHQKRWLIEQLKQSENTSDVLESWLFVCLQCMRAALLHIDERVDKKQLDNLTLEEVIARVNGHPKVQKTMGRFDADQSESSQNKRRRVE